jgi:predicted amidophosphoribosyltransferase
MTLSASAALRGARVCLVDDVCTTGATLEEARRACLEAGALSVEAFCLMSA